MSLDGAGNLNQIMMFMVRFHNSVTIWSQAKPKASIYWKSDPDFEQFEQKDEVIQTNKTFTTISKVRKSYSQIYFPFYKNSIQGNF